MVAFIIAMTDSTRGISVWSPSLSVHNAVLDHQHIVLLELSRELWCLLSESPRTTVLLIDLLADLAGCYELHHATELQILNSVDSSWLANYRENALFTHAQLRWYLSQAQRNELDRNGLRRVVQEWIEPHLLTSEAHEAARPKTRWCQAGKCSSAGHWLTE